MKTIIIYLFLFFQFALSGILAGITSLNKTEEGHLGSAVYFYETGKNDVFCVNPPLSKIITGLPVCFINPEYNWRSYSPRPQNRVEWVLGNAFINVNSCGTIFAITLISRLLLLSFILFGITICVHNVILIYSSYTVKITFTLLMTFSPLVIAWSATICPDVLAATMGIIGIYMLRKWLKSPDWCNASIAGFVLGLMLLTKLTWLVAVPIYIILWLLWRWIPDGEKTLSNTETMSKEKQTVKKQPRFRELFVVFCVSLYILNMGYLFDGTFTQLKDYKFMSGTLTGNLVDSEHTTVRIGNRFDGNGQTWETALGYLPLPFPKDFVQGIDTQKFDFERGIESFLNGNFSPRGWKSYYLYVLLYKEPIGFMLLFLIAVGMTFVKNYRLRKDEILLLVPLVTLLFFICMQNGISVHPRYILPCYPFMYLFASRVGLLFGEKRASCWIRGLVVTLLLWGITSSLLQYPHSMSYFNEFIGQKNGAKYLQGSNVDWGQNKYFFRDWCQLHGEITLQTSYLTKSESERLGIKNVQLFDSLKMEDLLPGWYAIGVYDLYGKSDQYHYFQQFEPVDWIGASVCIYHLTQEDINRLNIKEEIQ